MYSGEKTFRVFNKCKHDIGVKINNGTQSINIISGGFVMLSANNILYIENICRRRKFFSAGMLTIVDQDTGKEVTLEEIGGYTNERTEKHHSQEEVAAHLKKSAKQIEAWLDTIKDLAELHEIIAIAKEMDLQASKLRILQARVPAEDLLN